MSIWNQWYFWKPIWQWYNIYGYCKWRAFVMERRIIKSIFQNFIINCFNTDANFANYSCMGVTVDEEN